MALKDFNTATLKAKLVFLELTTTADTTLYTVPANSCFKAQTLSVSSRSGSPLTLDIYVTPVGSALNARHKVVVALTLQANDTRSFEEIFEGMMLNEGDFISVKASVANVVSCFLTGAEGS
jgi:hypothetical protein